MELSVCDWLLDLQSRWNSLYLQSRWNALYATGYWIYSQDGTLCMRLVTGFTVKMELSIFTIKMELSVCDWLLDLQSRWKFPSRGRRHKITNAETEGRLVTAYLRV
ncbi:hypothetical protein Peur_032392 [Populus x canadensis]